MNIPRIRLDVEGLKHSVVHCFNEHSLELGKIVQEELDKVLSKESIQKEIENQVLCCVNQAIKNISQNWTLVNHIETEMANQIVKRLKESK